MQFYIPEPLWLPLRGELSMLTAEVPFEIRASETSDGIVPRYRFWANAMAA